MNDQPFKEETVLQNLSAGGSYLRLKRMVHEGSQVSLAVRLSTARARTVLFFVSASAERFCAWSRNGTAATVSLWSSCAATSSEVGSWKN